MGFMAVVNGELKEALIFPESAKDRERLWWQKFLARTGRDLETFDVVKFVPGHTPNKTS